MEKIPVQESGIDKKEASIKLFNYYKRGGTNKGNRMKSFAEDFGKPRGLDVEALKKLFLSKGKDEKITVDEVMALKLPEKVEASPEEEVEKEVVEKVVSKEEPEKLEEKIPKMEQITTTTNFSGESDDSFGRKPKLNKKTSYQIEKEKDEKAVDDYIIKNGERRPDSRRKFDPNKKEIEYGRKPKPIVEEDPFKKNYENEELGEYKREEARKENLLKSKKERKERLERNIKPDHRRKWDPNAKKIKEDGEEYEISEEDAQRVGEYVGRKNREEIERIKRLKKTNSEKKKENNPVENKPSKEINDLEPDVEEEELVEQTIKKEEKKEEPKLESNISDSERQTINEQRIAEFFEQEEKENEAKWYNRKNLAKKIAGTAVSTFTAIKGIKGFVDVPKYIYQRTKVRGIFGMGKGLKGSMEDITEVSKRRQAEMMVKGESDIDRKKLFKDLHNRLALTKEGAEIEKVRKEIKKLKNKGEKVEEEIGEIKIKIKEHEDRLNSDGLLEKVEIKINKEKDILKKKLDLLNGKLDEIDNNPKLEVLSDKLKELKKNPKYKETRSKIAKMLRENRRLESGQEYKVLEHNQKLREIEASEENIEKLDEGKTKTKLQEDVKRLKEEALGSGRDDLINKIIEENRQKEEMKSPEREAEMKMIMDEYISTKITGVEATREGLNSLCMAGATATSGASLALRPLIYMTCSTIAKTKELSKESTRAKRSEIEAEEAEKKETGEVTKTKAEIEAEVKKAKVWFPRAIYQGMKETAQGLTFIGEGSKLKKSANFAKSIGAVLRFSGIAYGAVGDRYDDVADNLVEALEADSWNDALGNFKEQALDPNVFNRFDYEKGSDEALNEGFSEGENAEDLFEEGFSEDEVTGGISGSSVESTKDSLNEALAEKEDLKMGTGKVDVLEDEVTIESGSIENEEVVPVEYLGGGSVWKESENQLRDYLGGEPSDKVINRMTQFIVRNPGAYNLPEGTVFEEMTGDDLRDINWTKALSDATGNKELPPEIINETITDEEIDAFMDGESKQEVVTDEAINEFIEPDNSKTTLSTSEEIKKFGEEAFLFDEAPENLSENVDKISEKLQGDIEVALRADALSQADKIKYIKNSIAGSMNEYLSLKDSEPQKAKELLSELKRLTEGAEKGLGEKVITDKGIRKILDLNENVNQELADNLDFSPDKIDADVVVESQYDVSSGLEFDQNFNDQEIEKIGDYYNAIKKENASFNKLFEEYSQKYGNNEKFQEFKNKFDRIIEDNNDRLEEVSDYAKEGGQIDADFYTKTHTPELVKMRMENLANSTGITNLEEMNENLVVGGQNIESNSDSGPLEFSNEYTEFEKGQIEKYYSHHDKKIDFLKEELESYRTDYGDRGNFDKFEKAVGDEINKINNQLDKIRENLKTGHRYKSLIIEGDPSFDAEVTISGIARKIGLTGNRDDMSRAMDAYRKARRGQ